MISALSVLVSGFVAWRMLAVPSHANQRSAAELEVTAGELMAGIRVWINVSDSRLAASKGLVDFMAENDVRLVFVRIVDRLDLEIHIQARQGVTLSEPPSLCLIGPYSAPQDAGYESGCWGTPDIGEVLATALPTDGAGHPMFPAGRAIVFSASLHRGGLRCDYPPGPWLLTVEANPLVDATPMGARQLREIPFDVPWAGSGPLPFLPVPTVAYCGSANIVYKQQGEPRIASPSP